MPVLAEFSSATQSGHGEHATVLGPHHRVVAERRSLADIKAAVGGHQRRIRSVELQPLLVEKEHGHARLIFRLVPNLLHFELGRVHRYSRPGPFGQRTLRNVETINRRWDGEGLEGQKCFGMPPPACDSIHIAQCRQRNFSRGLSVRFKNFQFRSCVARILGDDFSADRSKSFQSRFALRNRFLPILLRRVRERN